MKLTEPRNTNAREEEMCKRLLVILDVLFPQFSLLLIGLGHNSVASAAPSFDTRT